MGLTMTLPAFITTIANVHDGMCRWPLGEPTHDMPVCGAPVDDLRPYCPDHCKRAYQPMQKRGREW